MEVLFEMCSKVLMYKKVDLVLLLSFSFSAVTITTYALTSLTDILSRDVDYHRSHSKWVLHHLIKAPLRRRKLVVKVYLLRVVHCIVLYLRCRQACRSRWVHECPKTNRFATRAQHYPHVRNAHLFFGFCLDNSSSQLGLITCVKFIRDCEKVAEPAAEGFLCLCPPPAPSLTLKPPPLPWLVTDTLLEIPRWPCMFISESLPNSLPGVWNWKKESKTASDFLERF